MKPVFLVVVAACSTLPLLAEPLNESERLALIDRLDALKDQATDQASKRLNGAAGAFKAAMMSGDAATDLFLKCVEKADFEMQDRDSSAFRDWKRRNKDRLDEDGHALALRHQLRWTVLTMQAAGNPADKSKLAGEMLEALEAIYREPKELRDHVGILGQSVTTTVFSRAYGLGGYKVEGWPMSPLGAGQGSPKVNLPFELIIFPALRQRKDFPALREAWDRRIHFEDVAYGFWVGKGEEDGMSPERERFLLEDKPLLVWSREEDLFKAGDEKQAALAMLKHLEQYIGHSNARGWEERFRELVDPKPEDDESTS